MTSDNEPKNLTDIYSKLWEVEILISGGAFFTLYQFSDFLSSLLLKLLSLGSFGGLIGFLVLGARILAIYFAIHLCFRGFWLALVSLGRIFSRGINADRLRLVEPFYSVAKDFSLSKRISDLDRLCSLIFAWAITFAVILVGLTFTFSVATAPALIAKTFFPDLRKSMAFRILMMAILASVFVFLTDTFVFGFLRKTNVLARFYYPIYRFWNVVSLGFAWRPNLQIIFSNAKSRSIAIAQALGMTLVVFIISGKSREGDLVSLFDDRMNSTERVVVEEKRYMDKAESDQWNGASIQSDVITEGYLKVYFDYQFLDDPKIDSLKSEKKLLSQVITLSIDDSVCNNVQWIGISKINGEKGIQAVLDVSALEKKLHFLKIERTPKDKLNDISIPFWKM